ncbi:MAG: hypothetical protein NTV09_01740 [Bacteroidetes bacterium]|nr:hypothetical protein [Bacteroidota bacterium]
MNQKENWIQGTLNTIDTIKRADISPELADRLSKISFAGGKVISIRPVIKWAIAASIVLLAGINIITILRYNSPMKSGQSENNPVYTEYFSYLNTL